MAGQWHLPGERRADDPGLEMYAIGAFHADFGIRQALLDEIVDGFCVHERANSCRVGDEVAVPHVFSAKQG